MRVLIVDDEPIAQEIIEKFTGRVPYLQVIGKCDNAIEALEEIRELKPDIVFLDIQMPEMTGMEMLNILRDNRPFVILTTAFPDFALDSYDMDVMDYLLKPIPFDRFLKAVTKCHDLFKLKRLQIADRPTKPPAEIDATYIWVKEGKKLVQLILEDIVMVKAMKDYMEIFLLDRKVIAHITMNKLEMILKQPKFLRVNRSCIIRKTAIRSVQDMRIETILKNEEKVIIGNTYWEDIKPQMKELF